MSSVVLFKLLTIGLLYTHHKKKYFTLTDHKKNGEISAKQEDKIEDI